MTASRRLEPSGVAARWTLTQSDRNLAEAVRELRDLIAAFQPVLAALEQAQPWTALTSGSPPARESRLTARETDVLALISRGLTARAAARSLRISERTVRKHLQNAYTKLDSHDRLQAVTKARQLGIVTA